jgi:hypothetical protein
MFRIFLIIVFATIVSAGLEAQENISVTANTSSRRAIMSNGIISITINSKGQVDTLIYNNQDLIDASHGGRFYFSYNDQDGYLELSPGSVRIQKQTDDYAEVVYSNNSGNLIMEQAYIMVKGGNGIYSYVTLKGTSAEVQLLEMRVVYRVSPSLFTYGYITDRMQGTLPSVETRVAVNDQPIMDATCALPDGFAETTHTYIPLSIQYSTTLCTLSSHSVSIFAVCGSACLSQAQGIRTALNPWLFTSLMRPSVTAGFPHEVSPPVASRVFPMFHPSRISPAISVALLPIPVLSGAMGSVL